jgi:hypothetical protein
MDGNEQQKHAGIDYGTAATTMRLMRRFPPSRLLFLGALLAFLSMLAWYAHWYWADSYEKVTFYQKAALIAYLLSLFFLILWLVRLKDQRARILCLAFLLTDLFLYAISSLINTYYLALFSFSRELLAGKSIEAYDPRYVTNWKIFFLQPFMYMLIAGSMVLTLSAMAILVERRLDVMR